MNIVNFLLYVLNTNTDISGLLTPSTFRQDRIIFDTLVSLLKPEQLERVRRTGDLFSLVLKNGNRLDVFYYNEYHTCGRRADFIINYNDKLNYREDLLPILVYRCNNDKKIKFIYDGNSDEFLYVNFI